MSHDTYVKELCVTHHTHMNDLHVVDTNESRLMLSESRHTHKQVAHTQMSHAIHMSESCHTHMNDLHVVHTNESRLMYA